MFRPVDNSVSFPKLELEQLEFWKSRKTYEKSLANRAGAPPFVFFEGPPTANGLPHPGHCLTRAIKDLFPRYRTMRGYLCERKAGWDTHGLPVEVEVCKELGIHSKEEIEQYGIEPFIQKCQQSVWRYMQQWERLTERLGFWVNLDDAYVTYHKSFVESVWWSLAELYKRGLLYQGYKIVWWWAQGGTALSSGEVGLGYREVADPSVYVRFPVLDDAGLVTNTSLLVWTTTPWTLPSNQFAAVHPELEYSVLRTSLTGDEENDPHFLVVAAALADAIRAKSKQELPEVSRMKGADLIGKRYVPPFDYYYRNYEAWGELHFAFSQKLVQEINATGRGDKFFADLLQQEYPDAVKPGEAPSSLTLREAHAREFAAGGPCRWLKAWRVVAADFVTTDSGTGVVHQAPAFGEVDYDVLIAQQQSNESPYHYRPHLINAVAPDGKFTAEAPDWQGRWVKDCDKDITRNLRDRGLLFHQEQYLHEYPFCWRAEEDPLIQYPRKSWFIRTTQFKDAMLANNEQINWLPEHIKHGRFGNFLETNVDWALSRERYWGTPLPIWVCEQTGEMEAIGSYDELLAKPGVHGTHVWEEAKRANPALVDDLKVHKPYIDAVTYDSPFSPGARMKRVTEVIDCWYDSGAMPFAQWGYPHQNQDKFHSQFPADFISEALDQTRGWFYSLLAISTLLFSADGKGNPKSEIRNPKSLEYPYPHPYRTCIVLGLMLSEWYEGPKNRPAGTKAQIFLSEDDAKKACGPGNYEQLVGKMSKQKRNYSEPQQIFDKYGADALRWYFFANQAPWTSIRYSETAIKESIPKFLLTLWNCYSFFVIYANSDDKFDPGERLAGEAGQLTAKELSLAKGYRPASQRRELDRWILSELNLACANVVERMDAYDNFGACKVLDALVDNLSNWYVRRSRSRFWSTEYDSPDKLDAYWTLYECLVTTCKLIAPFTPFVAEAMWRNLAGVFDERAVESVHLCDFPTGDAQLADAELSEQMELSRIVVSLGLRARANAKIKVRQPLAKVEVILANQKHQSWLAEHRDVVAEELNVKEVEFTDEPDKYINHSVQPNWKALGPKLGKLLPQVKKWLGEQTAADLLANLRDNGKIDLTINDQAIALLPEELNVQISAKPGWTAANDRGVVVVLATELTPQLVGEGLARDLVRAVNDLRKETGCQFTDRIDLAIVADSPELQQAIRDNAEYISRETQADSLGDKPLTGVASVEREIGDFQTTVYLRVK